MDTSARPGLPVRVLMREDFPVFECPMKASSGPTSNGMCSKAVLLFTKQALWMVPDCAGGSGSPGGRRLLRLDKWRGFCCIRSLIGRMDAERSSCS